MAESPLEPTEPIDPTVPPLPSDRCQSLPRLRLHHLFALTAAMAVLMGLSGPRYDFGDQSGGLPQLLKVILVAWGILYSILAAAAITVVAYGIAWRRRGILFFDQPGHWLMVEIAASAVLGLLPQVAYRLVVGSEGFGLIEGPWLLMIAIAAWVVILLPMALNIYIGLKQCHERRWKWVFYLKALARIVYVFGDFLVVIMLPRASLIDRRQAVRRDLLHRSGVSIQLALSLLTVFLTVFFMFSLSLRLWR
jgi:hypothetical protein